LKDAHHYGKRLIQLQQGQIIRDLDAGAKEKLMLKDMYGWFG
jgi:putative ABC transport system ATP-binding protein